MLHFRQVLDVRTGVFGGSGAPTTQIFAAPSPETKKKHTKKSENSQKNRCKRMSLSLFSYIQYAFMKNTPILLRNIVL